MNIRRGRSSPLDPIVAGGLGLAGALLALCATGASAQAASMPIAAERILIDFKGKRGPDPKTLFFRLAGNCIDVSPLAGWAVDFDGIDGTWGSGSLDTTGSIDVARREGSVTSTSRGAGVLFRTLFRKPGDGRPSLKLTDVGIELAGERAYLTGRLSRAASQSAAAKVQRVGLMRRPKLLMGQLHAPGKERRDIADTFAVAVQGKVTLTRVFARELERRRCRELASQGAGPVRAGRTIGRLTAQLLAGTATGLAGTVPVGVDFSTTAEDPVRVSVAGFDGLPVGVGENGAPRITLPTAPGNLTSLGCVILTRYPGQACAPLGAVVALSGGVVLGLGDRTATVANLSIAYASDARSDSYPSSTLSATMNGAPVTLAASSSGSSVMVSTAEALAAIGAALGAEVEGGVWPELPTFSTVGPPTS